MHKLDVEIDFFVKINTFQYNSTHFCTASLIHFRCGNIRVWKLVFGQDLNNTLFNFNFVEHHSNY
jgi:hypothetical protein